MTEHAPFDRMAVRRHRDRAAPRNANVRPVLDAVAERLLDRLDDVTRRFDNALELGGRGVVAPRLVARGIPTTSLDLSEATVRQAGGTTAVVGDEERLPFADGVFDLVVASLGLHWVNDLPGTLVQLRRALCPDGLLLAAMPVLDTLRPLRQHLIEAELALTGGAAPRVSPFPELRDAASLLQRAGFAMPVVDADTVALAYAEPFALLRDLRDAGETNALRLRDRRIPPRALFPAALAGWQAALTEAADDGSGAGTGPSTDGHMIGVELKLAMLTAWAPSPTQRPPMKRGVFETNLNDVFGTPRSNKGD